MNPVSAARSQSTVPPSGKPSSFTPPPPPPSISYRLWRWWATLTGPQQEAFKADIFAQERLRRARLISALLLLVVAVIALLIPSTFPSSPSIWTPIAILSVGGFVIAFCNRAGYTTLSAIFYVLLIDSALTGFFYFKPIPTLNSTNMTTFDLFILAVLVGGLILPKGLIPLSGIFQIVLLMMIFFVRPHDASLTALIDFAGNPYVALMPTIVLHLVGTALAWLHAWSVERALIRASQAEELAEARAELSRQAILTAKQKQRLEEGITSILETHRQIAAGNLNARTPIHEDHELWQIGHSLNLLLARVQQQTHDYQGLQLTYREIEYIIHVLNTVNINQLPKRVPYRTSLAQRLLMSLRR